MKNFFELIGRYFMLMSKAFSRPEKFSIYRKRILVEMASLGLNSIGIVAIISVFMGAVITIQMALNLQSPFIPKYLIGYATRESMLLEFSSTVVALILAGKVGSNIASEIGTMKVDEEISALATLGIRPEAYLVLPKLLAMLVALPVLTVFGDLAGLLGGMAIGVTSMGITPAAYWSRSVEVLDSITFLLGAAKSFVFAVLITLAGCYCGFNASSDAQGVGRAATSAVVVSIFLVVIAEAVLTILYSFIGY